MAKETLAKTGVNGIQNALLRSLPPKRRNAVLGGVELTPLPVRTVLIETDRPIQFAYFINSGLASILNVMSNGKSVEVGLVGSEGFIGTPLLADFRTSPTRIIMQVEGSGFRIPAQRLRKLIASDPSIRAALEKFNQELSIQATQTAACNRLHGVEQRLARWLLMTQDRVGDSFNLTQEFLAHMLGTRRATVTITSGILQKAGLINSHWGQITIKDRKGLEDASCECYEAINQRIKTWRNDGS
jgi:CRP-like cAMP-binding protein